MNDEPSEPFARHTLKQEGKAETAIEKQGAVSFEAEKQAKREERNRQRKLASLEEQIHALESDITELEAEMTLPEIYQDYMALQERQQSLEEKRVSLSKFLPNGSHCWKIKKVHKSVSNGVLHLYTNLSPRMVHKFTMKMAETAIFVIIRALLVLYPALSTKLFTLSTVSTGKFENPVPSFQRLAKDRFIDIFLAYAHFWRICG